MPRLAATAAAACAALVCLMLPVPRASANQPLDAVTRNYADAPVWLGDCKAALTDTEFGNVDYYVHPTVTIMNLGRKDVIAVKVQFRTLNSFDEKLDEYIGLSDHRVQPEYQYDTEWDFLNLYSTAKKVICEVYAVRFSDGTTWTNSFKYPMKSGPAPSRAAPKPQPRATPAPHAATPRPKPKPRATGAPVSSAHPATCRVKLADGSEIEIPWDNPGCADARRAAGNASPSPAIPGDGKAGPGTTPAPTGPGAGAVTYDRGDAAPENLVSGASSVLHAA